MTYQYVTFYTLNATQQPKEVYLLNERESQSNDCPLLWMKNYSIKKARML